MKVKGKKGQTNKDNVSMKHKDMKKDEHACIDNLQALFEIGRKLNINRLTERSYRMKRIIIIAYRSSHPQYHFFTLPAPCMCKHQGTCNIILHLPMPILLLDSRYGFIR